jgi:hypothetical protein
MVEIGSYNFEGPHTNTGLLRDDAGVYVILTLGQYSNTWIVIDVGESSQVKARIETHERQDCWQRNNEGTVAVGVLYTPGWTVDQRRTLEGILRAQYAPVCGVR